MMDKDVFRYCSADSEQWHTHLSLTYVTLIQTQGGPIPAMHQCDLIQSQVPFDNLTANPCILRHAAKCHAILCYDLLRCAGCLMSSYELLVRTCFATVAPF